MKRGETDLSEVVTALLSFHFYPLSALLFLLLSASSSLSSLHLYALFPLFNSVLSPLSFNLPVMFPLLFSSLLFSSLLFYSILFYSIYSIPLLCLVLWLCCRRVGLCFYQMSAVVHCGFTKAFW